MAFLMDTGFWYASIDLSDEYNAEVAKIAVKIHEAVVLPCPVITETAYLVLKNQGVAKLAEFSENLSVARFDLETPTDMDLLRIAEIVRKYNDINIDFVDACIVAMAERLNITKILTVDRRHFQLFRPNHCTAFEILP